MPRANLRVGWGTATYLHVITRQEPALEIEAQGSQARGAVHVCDPRRTKVRPRTEAWFEGAVFREERQSVA
jgi:hypothetical protein